MELFSIHFVTIYKAGWENTWTTIGD